MLQCCWTTVMTHDRMTVRLRTHIVPDALSLELTKVAVRL